MERIRVVVTGLGAMTPLGQTPEKFWENLVAGKSGIGPMTLCDPTDYPCRISGEVKDFDPGQYMNAREARRMARFSQLAVA
ncbi:MAG TPA: beta-ketoacyl synthase N-terminal-like domain-containing protein, partial [Dehalococcoidia bacterium]|nr:beta-ketoacyl synthase N-terminal-like domain-containing protein [Dehalococcoidia bacterium]